MRLATILILMVCVTAMPLTAAAERPGPVKQLTTVPGEWEMQEGLLPPLAEIQAQKPGDRPVYGLYLWCGEYRNHRESIRKVGWRAVRIAGLMDDETMAMLAADDIQVMMTVGVYATGEKANRTAFDSDEAFLAAYIKGLEDFLGRYGPGGSFFRENPDVPDRPIMYVEIWNEPNFQYMIPDRTPRAEVEAEREALYAKVLPAAYKAVKAKWPTVAVVGFGAGGASAGDLRFIKHVHELSPAIGKSYDILSTHPYSRPAPPETWSVKPRFKFSVASGLAEIRKTMQAGGAGGKPVWYTEVGWPISQADGGRYPTKAEPMASPMHQAAYVCRLYAFAVRLGVPRVQIMFATDTDNFNAGFFLQDKSWRPSAYAVQTMIHLMPHPKLIGAIHDGEGGLYAYTFIADAKAKMPSPVGMVWNVAGPKTVSLPVGKAVGPAVTRVDAVDMFGHRQELTVADGKVSVDIGPCPVYLVPHVDAE